MKIKIKELEIIFLELLLKIKEKFGEEIELKNDYYWEISNKEIYNPYKEPESFTLGQLSEEVETIIKLNHSDDLTVYDIKRVGDILKAISIESR